MPDFFPSLDTLAVALPTLVVSYVIFGIAGFGSALIAAPVLAQIMPVATIVPLLALLDCSAATATGISLGDKVDKSELIRLVPLMVLGSVAGVYLLLIIPAKPMMLALGVFIVAYAAYSFFVPPPSGKLRQGWVLLFGTVGGVFSAMFGSGGFIYALYLSRRLDDVTAVRATQSALLGMSTITRTIFFAIAGIYSDWRLPVLALCLLPAAAIGIFAGHHVTLRLSRGQFLRVLYAILLVTGSALILRAQFGAAA